MAVNVLCSHYVRVTAEDQSGGISNIESAPVRFGLGPVGGLAPIDQEYSCPAGQFTAFTVPTGARVVVIRTTAPSLVLKGVTGDGTGLVLTPASNVLPVDNTFQFAGSSLGVLNNGSTAAPVRVIWF